MTSRHCSGLPYRWVPDGAKPLKRGERPHLGALVAINHRVYRVTRVTAVDPIDDGISPGPYTVDVDDVETGDPYVIDVTAYTARSWTWWIYPDEHYPICARCRQPTPCADVAARRIAREAAQEMELYATPGVCPACQEPVTTKQQKITFGENMKVPGGPPITFHRRKRCAAAARQYEQLLLSEQVRT